MTNTPMMNTGVTNQNVRLISAAVTDRGLSHKRPVNEDSYLEMGERNLFAVADGVGGAQGGDFASATAMNVLQNHFLRLPPNADLEQQLATAIERANETIFQIAEQNSQVEMMATTIVALAIHNNIAIIGHVGDSRLYKLDQNGKLTRETIDHSVVEEEVRAGRMTAAQAANHPSRNVISRALGAESTVEVELRSLRFEPGTTFLLCSDGITRHVSDQEIAEVLNRNDSLHQACQEFKTLCYNRGAEDNLTALIVRAEDINHVAVENDEEATITNRPQNFSGNVLPTFSNNLDDFKRGINAAENRSSEFAAAPPTAFAAKTTALEPLPTVSEAPAAAAPTTTGTAAETLSSVRLSDAPQQPLFADGVNRANSAQSAEQTLRSGADEVPQHQTFDSGESANVPSQKSGLAGKVVSSLSLLLIGAAIGAGLIYAATMLNPPAANAPVNVAQVATTQQPSVATAPAATISEFERTRQTIDQQPDTAGMIVENPQTAQDYYFLGRAYVQIGEYENARAAFARANDLLAISSDADKLRVDLAIAQAAVGAMTQTSSDRRKLSELVKTKQASKTGVGETNQSGTNP